MVRTNIYLEDDQLKKLRAVGEMREQPVSEIVREAIDAWLQQKNVRFVDKTEWQENLKAFLDRRAKIAEGLDIDEEELEREIMEEVKAVRAERKARSASSH